MLKTWKCEWETWEYTLIEGIVYSRHRSNGDGFFTEWEQEYAMTPEEFESMPEYEEEWNQWEELEELIGDEEDLLEEE